MDPDDDTPAPPGTYGLVRLLTVVAYVGLLWASAAAAEEQFSYEVAAVVTLDAWVVASGMSLGALSQHRRRVWGAITSGIVLGVALFVVLLFLAFSRMGS